MTDERNIDSLYGKTLRLTFTDGAMAGKTYDHVFHKDGTVVFSAVDGATQGKPTSEKDSAAVKVADGIFVISYLGASGYTLTTVLNLLEKKLVCFASNNKEWSQQTGTFEVLE
jgi:phenolic acid decarboxylase